MTAHYMHSVHTQPGDFFSYQPGMSVTTSLLPVAQSHYFQFVGMSTRHQHVPLDPLQETDSVAYKHVYPFHLTRWCKPWTRRELQVPLSSVGSCLNSVPCCGLMYEFWVTDQTDAHTVIVRSWGMSETHLTRCLVYRQFNTMSKSHLTRWFLIWAVYLMKTTRLHLRFVIWCFTTTLFRVSAHCIIPLVYWFTSIQGPNMSYREY